MGGLWSNNIGIITVYVDIRIKAAAYGVVVGLGSEPVSPLFSQRHPVEETPH